MGARLVAVLKRPATWGWLVAAASAAGLSVSPEMRGLLADGLPVALQVVFGG